MDILSKEERSERMRRIKSSGSKEEVLLAKSLWRANLRYRKNNKKIFGKPDLTFAKYKIAIFIDSEFFHGKDWTSYKYRIKPEQDFWLKKISRNIERDKEVNEYLTSHGWTVLRFWSQQVKKDLDGVVAVIMEVVEKAKGTSAGRS